MRDRVLNFLIGFLSFMIFAALALVVIFTFIGYNVTIKLNGASSVEKEEIRCHMTLLGCYVKMPEAKRDNGVVLGYAYNASDHDVVVENNGRIKIEEETDLYVVSYQTYNVHVEKSDVDYLESSDVSCKAYNSDESCKLKLPLFNKVGYQNAGYSKTSTYDASSPNEYFPFIETEIKENLTLYPNYTDSRDVEEKLKKVYDNGNVYSIRGSFVEFENGLSQDIIDKYKGYLEEISNKAPYLFVGEKINILKRDTFQGVWREIGSDGLVLGICVSNSILGFPLSRSVEVFYYTGFNDSENYRTLVHEMSHAFDLYYGYAITGKVPDIVDANTGMRQVKSINDALDKVYGKSRISSQSDIASLIKKYENASTRPIDKQGYAYTKNLEFVAEAISWYYMQFVISDKNFKDSYFPDDLKQTIEKYICTANNGYDKIGC